jgi:hypothetical protein
MELGDLLREDAVELVDDLVDDEVHDGEVGHEPGVQLALLLVETQQRLDLLLPVVGHALLVLQLAVRPAHAGHSDHGRPQVAPTADAVQPTLVFGGLPEEVRSSGLLEEVGDDADGASDHEVAVLQEGQVAHHPLLGLTVAEERPLVRGEETVAVGQLQVLAEQAADLPLGAEGVIADH